MSRRPQLLLALTFPLLLIGCNPCEDEVLARFPSPTEDREVVLFRRNCGATTAYNWQLALTDPGSARFAQSVVFYVSEREPNGEGLIDWTSSDTVRVVGAPDTRFKKLPVVGDVHILYE